MLMQMKHMKATRKLFYNIRTISFKDFKGLCMSRKKKT